MGWLQRKFALRNAHRRLNALLAQHLPADHTSHSSMQGDKLAPQTAHRLCLLIEENPEHGVDIVLGFAKMGNIYFALERRVRSVLDNFGFAVSLGTHAPFDVIRRALGDLDDVELSTEQQQALIRLEDSRWSSTRTVRSAEMPLHAYEAFVALAVMERPKDTDRIIAIAQSGSCENMLQMNAVLDGHVVAALAEGAL